LLLLGIEVACWTITSERQAARVRNLYFKTILRQDIAYFDKEATTGEVIEKMSRDIFLIQGAMGEKVLLILLEQYRSILYEIVMQSYTYDCFLLIFLSIALKCPFTICVILFMGIP